MIDRKIVMPSKDLLEIHKMVNKTIVKRDHKKIDYDRHSDSLRKVKASSEDERKVIKAQNTVDVAFAEYEKYNMLLKSELPVYIQLRIDFIDPILLSMLEFQNTLFSEMCRNLEPLKSATDMRFSAMDGFEIQKESINAMFNEITLLSAPITGKQHRKGGETGEFDDDFDGEDTNPFNSYHETGETIAVTNPFFPNPRENSNNPPAPNKRQLAVCLYDFEPQQEGDLKIRKGDQIEVLERTADTNGWWRGRSLNGEEGLFPGNYVKQLD